MGRGWGVYIYGIIHHFCANEHKFLPSWINHMSRRVYEFKTKKKFNHPIEFGTKV